MNHQFESKNLKKQNKQIWTDRFLTSLKFHDLSIRSETVLSVAIVNARIGHGHITDRQLHYVIGIRFLERRLILKNSLENGSVAHDMCKRLALFSRRIRTSYLLLLMILSIAAESRLKLKTGVGWASTSHSSVTSSPGVAMVITEPDMLGRPFSLINETNKMLSHWAWLIVGTNPWALICWGKLTSDDDASRTFRCLTVSVFSVTRNVIHGTSDVGHNGHHVTRFLLFD